MLLKTPYSKKYLKINMLLDIMETPHYS